MNLDAYLDRIGLQARPPATLEGLRTVHRAHLLAIPYENIDVQLARPLTTAPADAFDKLVSRRRGGWCYEMNGLLGWALGELGFKVTRATGAVHRALGGDSTVGNHLVLRVDLPEGVWLADAGFGDGPLDPIRVVEGPFTSHGFGYGLAQLDERWWRFSDLRPGAKSFDFDLKPADESVFAERCHYLQTAPQSNFVLNLTAQRHVPGGHRILRGRTMLDVTPQAMTERLIESADDLVATLKDVFTLDVPEAATLWPKVVARHEEVMAQKRAAAAQA